MHTFAQDEGLRLHLLRPPAESQEPKPTVACSSSSAAGLIVSAGRRSPVAWCCSTAGAMLIAAHCFKGAVIDAVVGLLEWSPCTKNPLPMCVGEVASISTDYVGGCPITWLQVGSCDRRGRRCKDSYTVEFPDQYQSTFVLQVLDGWFRPESSVVRCGECRDDDPLEPRLPFTVLQTCPGPVDVKICRAHHLTSSYSILRAFSSFQSIAKDLGVAVACCEYRLWTLDSS